MQKIILTAVSSAVVFVGFATTVIAQQAATAKIVLRDGTKYDVLEFDEGGRHKCLPFLNNEEIMVTRPSGDAEVPLSVNEVQQLEIADYPYGGKPSHRDHFNGVEGFLVFKNGRRIRLGSEKQLGETQLYVKDDGECKIDILDDFTGRRQTIDFDFNANGERAVALVDFEGVGNVLWSPSSDRIFPQSYSFDPFTGEKLVPTSEND